MLSGWQEEEPCAADEIFGTADTDRRIARRVRLAPAGAVLS
jgi:hypothetical protein